MAAVGMEQTEVRDVAMRIPLLLFLMAFICWSLGDCFPVDFPMCWIWLIASLWCCASCPSIPSLPINWGLGSSVSLSVVSLIYPLYIFPSIFYLMRWFSQCGSFTCSTIITWELVRNANSCILPQSTESETLGSRTPQLRCIRNLQRNRTNIT